MPVPPMPPMPPPPVAPPAPPAPPPRLHPLARRYSFRSPCCPRRRRVLPIRPSSSRRSSIPRQTLPRRRKSQPKSAFSCRQLNVARAAFDRTIALALLSQFFAARSITEVSPRPVKLTGQAQLSLGKRTG